MKNNVKRILCMLMVFFVTVEFLLSGGVAAMAQNSTDAAATVNISALDETVLSGESHKVHISANNNIQKEICLKVYLKNVDGTAATDVSIWNITEPDVVQMEQRDIEGNAAQRYLQTVLPAGGTADFDILLSVDCGEEQQEQQIVLEAQVWEDDSVEAGAVGQSSITVTWKSEAAEEDAKEDDAEVTQTADSLMTLETDADSLMTIDEATDSLMALEAGADSGLTVGDYLYLNTSGFTAWEEAGAVFALRYESSGSSVWLVQQMEEWETHLYRVKIPADMKSGGNFQFVRVNPANTSEIWNYNQDTNLSSALAAGSNTFRVTGYESGAWEANTWNISNYAGEVIYFFNMETLPEMFPEQGTLEAEFTVSGETDAGSDKIEMTAVSGTTVIYQGIIPEGDYDTVTFSKNGEELVTEKIIKGTYAPGSTNTLYWHVSKTAEGNYINAWEEYPAAASGITGKTLYLDKLSFSAGQEATIQIGTGAEVPLTTVSDDAKTYSYVIPSESEATQRTVITVRTGGAEYHFLWKDLASNLLILENDVALVSGTYSKSYTVYFDAAVSKLSYAGSAIDASIPLGSNKIYYHAWNTATDFEDGELALTASHSQGSNKWTDVYKGELSKEFTNIIFYSSSGLGNYPTAKAAQTVDLVIPWDSVENPCFYPDTSDDSVYNNANRSGYWNEVYTIRNAEEGKNAEGKNKDVVDIEQGTFTREEEANYINATFFDYYTDYELNGNNRDDYNWDNTASQRNWVNFRQFNQALSDYYREANVSIPVYVGHFQPSGMGIQFADIAGTLNLFGWDNYANFISTNNSNYDVYLSGGKVNCATQGLIADTLNDGDLMAKGGTVPQPLFDRSFLQGNNSKNSVLGQVYEDVSFPFKKKELTMDGKTATYWYFNSSETTLQMKTDSTSGYYLEDVGNQNWSKNVDSRSSTSGVTNTYGFFPFNNTAAATTASTYNYGFGVKLQFNFRLTEDGTILAENNGVTVPITFNFSGDDDVWVFIDGKLALDIGGSHGRVDGSLDFSNQTATVSAVKASAGSGSTETTTTFELEGRKTDEHTLTMYYMERGMWESNMQISFNFPDENQLQVEKVVDKTDLNELFWDVFDNQSLYRFNIKNLATHYGTKEVEEQQLLPETYNADFSSGSIGATYSTTVFEHIAQQGDQTDVVHWRAAEDDRTGSYRSLRYGVIYPESGGTADISHMNYLEFKYYYDYFDTPTLANMYLQIVDSNGKTLGSSTEYLSGKTYGVVSMASRKWVTVRIDLSRLIKETGFDATNVAEIRFGYNYSRDIYLNDFIFYPESISSSLTGFVMKQYEIPDYGSAQSGQLEVPVGAVYSSSVPDTNGNIKKFVIGTDGTFYLENHETATFSDQFRRGSYIALEEQIDSKLFDVSWTMYENGVLVDSMNEGTGNIIKNSSEEISLIEVLSSIVDDGRTEVYRTGSTDGNLLQNAYNGVRPDNTFVFRSYLEPDIETTTTKLKVVFTNKIKTGSLTIKKTGLCERDKENLTGTYRFKVTFSNVGGYDLEPTPIEPVEVELKVGEEYTISGIPIGTHYSVEEILPEDGSELKGIFVHVGSEPGKETSRDDMILIEGNTVSGLISSEASHTTVKFQNTIKPVIKVSLEKLWKDMDGNSLTAHMPSSIYVQLQRRIKGSDGEYTAVPGYEKLTITQGSDGSWKYTIPDLEKYEDYKDADNINEWEYRLMETDSQGNIIENNTFLKNFLVTYTEPQTDSGTDDTICTITNTLYDKTNLKIMKYGVGSEAQTLLSGATFKLEKLDADGNIDSTVSPLNGTTGEKDYDGDGYPDEGILVFENVPDGTWLLTEIETAAGYSLLKEPITVVLDRENGCTVNGKDYTVEQQSNTITLKISNRLKLVLPATGGFGIFFIIISGIGITAAGISIYKTHRREKIPKGDNHK